MGIMDKALAKALGSIDVDELATKLTERIYENLAALGHSIQGTWSGDYDWTCECLNCDFVAQGNSGGKSAVDALASVHLGEVRG